MPLVQAKLGFFRPEQTPSVEQIPRAHPPIVSTHIATHMEAVMQQPATQQSALDAVRQTLSLTPAPAHAKRSKKRGNDEDSADQPAGVRNATKKKAKKKEKAQPASFPKGSMTDVDDCETHAEKGDTVGCAKILDKAMTPSAVETPDVLGEASGVLARALTDLMPASSKGSEVGETGASLDPSVDQFAAQEEVPQRRVGSEEQELASAQFPSSDPACFPSSGERADELEPMVQEPSLSGDGIQDDTPPGAVELKHAAIFSDPSGIAPVDGNGALRAVSSPPGGNLSEYERQRAENIARNNQVRSPDPELQTRILLYPQLGLLR